MKVRVRPAHARSVSAPSAAAGWCFGGFLLVTACVVLGLTDAFDRQVFAFARPHDEWGRGQVLWAGFVDALRPPVAATALAAVAVLVCLVRRTLRPAVVALTAGGVAAVATLLVKFAVGRPDPHATGGGHGGSFPSGHTVGVVTCAGLAVLLLWPEARRWVWAVAGAAGVVMGIGLVVIGAHWAGDVVGGLLLGLGIVFAAAPATAPARRGAAGGPSGSDGTAGRPGSSRGGVRPRSWSPRSR